MNVVKLQPFGVQVTDLDLAKPRTSEENNRLLELFNEEYLLVVRGQNLSDEDHLRFFHDVFPGEDLGDETGTGSEISYVSNATPEGIFGDTALSFHSDFAFTTEPTRLISLYGYEVEQGAAATEFSSGQLVLDRLPAEFRTYLEDKRVVSATDRLTMEARIPNYSLPDTQDLSGRSYEDVVRASWPVILNHPRTGRPVVFVNELHAHHILGVPLAEGREVLSRLCEYLYSEDNIYSHKWEQGDFVLWDNVGLSHGRRATPASTARRTLRRVRGGGASNTTLLMLSQVGLDESEQGLTGDFGVSPRLQTLRRTLGLRIRDFRMARGLTQDKLGSLSEFTGPLIAQFELGNSIPTVPQLCVLAELLQVDPGRFVEGLALESRTPELSAG